MLAQDVYSHRYERLYFSWYQHTYVLYRADPYLCVYFVVFLKEQKQVHCMKLQSLPESNASETVLASEIILTSRDCLEISVWPFLPTQEVRLMSHTSHMIMLLLCIQ